MHVPSALLVASLLAIPSTPPPDEGYDFLVLDIPQRLVFPDTLAFTVRGRPTVAYSVLGDIGNNTTPFGRTAPDIPDSVILRPVYRVDRVGPCRYSIVVEWR